MPYKYIQQIEGIVRLLILLLSIILTNSFSSKGQISFAPYQTGSSITNSKVLSIGDVNNDGLNDIVVATSIVSSGNYQLYVFLQSTSGFLTTPTIYDIPLFYPGATSIVIDDINNDNRKDIIITEDTIVIIYFQNHQGTLNPYQIFTHGSAFYICGMGTGDMNNDGLTDIVLNNWKVNSISIMYQNSNGSFNIIDYPRPSLGAMWYLSIGDINNDNLSDVVIAVDGASSLLVLYQNTSGLLDPALVFPHICNTECAEIGDVNNDGLNDIVSACYVNTPNSQLLLYYQNTLTNQIDTPIGIPALDSPVPIRIADLNCDGKNEVVIAHGGFQEISVFEQNSSGIISTYSTFNVSYASHYGMYEMSVGDINNDQKPDIIFTNESGNIEYLLNQSSILGQCCVSPEQPPKPIGDSVICQYSDTTIFALGSSNNQDITWELEPTLAGTFLFENNDSCSIAWNSSWSGLGKLYIKAVNLCGMAVSDTFFIVKSNTPILNLGVDTFICERDSLIISAQSYFETQYQWQNNSTDSTFIVTQGGLYFVLATNVCGSDTDSIFITEVPLPLLSLPDDTVFCDETPVLLDATNSLGYSYLWSTGSTNHFIEVMTPGQYTVIVTDSNSCKNKDTIAVTELFSPLLNFNANLTICTGASITLNAFNNNCTYLWHDGSTDAQFVVQDSGLYYVTVQNFCGATTDSTTVKVNDCSDYLDLPTAFSPNEDGINDVLYVVARNIENINWIVYDRWGEKVYECHTPTLSNVTNPECGWDGTFRGNNLDAGGYMYYLSGQSVLDGRTIQKSGNFTLVR